MNKSYEAIIIGGGVSGASIAYHLAKQGMKHIAVYDQGYQGNGSTSRCGAGIRQQWGTEMNCRLSKYACSFFETAQDELEYPTDLEFKQGGYLLLAYGDAEYQQFKRNVALQNSLGIDSELMTVEQAKHLVPLLNTDGLVGATYCESDGHLNPFKVLDAFVRAGKRLGVTYHMHQKVTDIIVQRGCVHGVEVAGNIVKSPIVVNAAGAYAKAVAAMAGVDIPTSPQRHQIMVTVKTRPLLKPMVMSFSKNIYIQQVPNGSLLMGRSDHSEPRDINNQSTWAFMEKMAETAVDLLPDLARINVLRSWAGQYTYTPDKQPILDAVATVDGLYLAVGFSGHGFMMSPATGLAVSEMILGKVATLDVAKLSLNRFASGELVIEPSVV